MQTLSAKEKEILGNDFDKYCYGLSEQKIQNMTTEEWLNIYAYMIDLCNKIDCGTNEFVQNHKNAVMYLYSNYRQTKETSRKIKELAYQTADSLSTSKEFLQLYYDIEVAVYETDKKKLVQILRKTVYDKTFGHEILSKILRPKLKIEDDNNMYFGGNFEKRGAFQRSMVKVRKSTAQFTNTVAHELFHSLQHLKDTKRLNLFKKLGINLTFDKSLGSLYKLNNFYYFLTADRQGPEFLAYKKQPLEYGASFFATCFERRLRQNFNVANKNWHLLYETTQILRRLGVDDKRIFFKKENISIVIDTSDEKQQSILREFKAKYLGQSKLFLTDKDTTLLTIDGSIQNKINISNLYKQMLGKDELSKEEYIKKFFPITYEIFYLSKDERAVKSPLLSKVMINRSR